MISVRNLTKIYKIKKSGGKQVVALDGVDIDFPDTGLVFLLGKSGSGKSTLLNSIGGLDTFDSGEIIIKGRSSKSFKQSDFDSYRNTFIGFIFQEYNVLEEFTVGKNLSLALELQGQKASKRHVNELLKQVDLEGYYKRKPNQLSGGQKQRVAIARALIKNPEIIMADEPTGALDSATGKQVMDTLKKLSKTKLVIIVSHDREFAEIYGDRIIELKDGKIISDETKTEIEPVKSASGVSFIDDKIIHIQKGKSITKEDLVKINQLIVRNITKEDTIISFDPKSNNDVKKSAFITEDGNREVFVPTSEEDILQSPHDPKDFKMIKSKLRMKDSFKMGASSLKHKPIRLIFTILLSVFAFGLFGVVNTISSFNRADAVYSSLQELEVDTISVNKRGSMDSFNEVIYPIHDDLFNKFQADNKKHVLHKVIGSNRGFELYLSETGPELGVNYDYNLNYTVSRKKISGLMKIDATIKEQFDLTLQHGTLAQNNNEVCISSNLFATITSLYDTISSWDDLNDKFIKIEDINLPLKIVGVLDDDTNVDKYKDLTGATSSTKHRSQRMELDKIMHYSLINMCYVNAATFNTCEEIESNNSSNTLYQLYINDKKSYTSNYYYSHFYGINDYSHSGEALFWSDPNANITVNGSHFSAPNLKDDEIIISNILLTDRLNIAENDLLTTLQKGLRVYFGYGDLGRDAPAFSLKVVGCFDGGERAVVSNNFYNKWFTGCDYIITNFSGSYNDKKLISYFENYDDTALYNVQFSATPTLDSFDNMFSNASKILMWIGVGLAAFSALMLMNFISISITYKKREIGVLRALGARSKDVFSIFFSESFIICMINFVLSSIGTYIVCSIINNTIATKIGVSVVLLTFGLTQILLLFAVSLAVAIIATFLPVYRFAKKNPIDSINNR